MMSLQSKQIKPIIRDFMIAFWKLLDKKKKNMVFLSRSRVTIIVILAPIIQNVHTGILRIPHKPEKNINYFFFLYNRLLLLVHFFVWQYILEWPFFQSIYKGLIKVTPGFVYWLCLFLSPVTCHMSLVFCHMSTVTFYLYPFTC